MVFWLFLMSEEKENYQKAILRRGLALNAKGSGETSRLLQTEQITQLSLAINL